VKTEKPWGRGWGKADFWPSAWDLFYIFKMYFSTLKIKIVGAQNGNKSSQGIIRLSKEDMELFKTTKSRFALRFFRFARDPDLKSVKFALKCKM